jgi:RNA polymerase sigma-70 factor (ECF subfamily)
VQSDADLVKAALDGERDAFAVLVKRYKRPVRAVAMDVLGDHTSAQDAAQDAFVRAYENLPALRKSSAFGPWLIKITRRCALSMASQRPRETTLEPTDAFPSEGKDGQLDEQKQRLLAAVVKLPESERQVVMLRYFSGHSVRDVAAILSRGVGTVTGQLSRAHKRLRNILERPEK